MLKNLSPTSYFFCFILFSIVPISIKAQNSQLVRKPYLQSGTSSTIVLKWRTTTATVGKVWYGNHPTQLSQSKSSNSVQTDHEIYLSNLSPNTIYYYAIGDSNTILAGGDDVHYFKTAPTTGIAHPTRAWILGDCGTGTRDQLAVRDAYYNYIGNNHTDLILLLGDNAYNSGTDAEYQKTVFDVYSSKLTNSTLWSAPGNHDYYTQNGLGADYYNIFTFPTRGEAGGLASNSEKYYAFDYGNIHFISLDSHDENKELGSPMLTWLENDLAATRQEWIVVLFHHPPYSKGSHDSDTEYKSSAMRENVLPMLDAYGVDLVLSGHSHSYERSKLIQGHYGSSNTYNSNVHTVDGGDGRLQGNGAYQKNDSGEGVVYVVTGSAGKTSPMQGTHPVMYYSKSKLGSTILEINGEQMDVKFLNANGVIEDYLTIKQNNAISPNPVNTNTENGQNSNHTVDCSKVSAIGGTEIITVEGIAAKRAVVKYSGANTNFKVQTVCDGNCSNAYAFNATAGEYTLKIQLYGQDGSSCYTERKVTVGGTPISNSENIDELANCESITAYSAGNNIVINGVNTTNAIIRIYTENWQEVYNCLENCDNSQIPANLSTGIYWVKVQVYDGQWKFLCETLISVAISSASARSVTAKNVFSTFPNPVQEDIFIDLLDYSGKQGQLKIVNQLGQLMKTVELDNIPTQPLKVDLTDFQNGMYFLTVSITGTPISTQKILVDKLY